MHLDKEQEAYSFQLDVIGSRRSESDIREALTKATREALSELGLDPDMVDADIEGGFAGIGEVAVLLIIKKVGAIVGAAALAGAGKKAGELFIERYVWPRLRSLNLLPKEIHQIPGAGRES